jgi:hypothetical protein
LHDDSWFIALIVLVVLLLANLFCWLLGVGSHTNLPDGTEGTELERYFGWPAQYRAELWSSGDTGLASVILKAAPFYTPGVEMERRVRYTGVAAVLVDVLFACLLAGFAAVAVERLYFGATQWCLLRVGVLLIVGLVLLFLASDRVCVSQ